MVSVLIFYSNSGKGKQSKKGEETAKNGKTLYKVVNKRRRKG